MYDRRKEDLNCVHKLKIHLERFNSTGDIVVVMDRIDTNECPFISFILAQHRTKPRLKCCYDSLTVMRHFVVVVVGNVCLIFE